MPPDEGTNSLTSTALPNSFLVVYILLPFCFSSDMAFLGFGTKKPVLKVLKITYKSRDSPIVAY
jgi:hypothetical protein